MWNPFSWVMEAAAIMATALAHGGACLLSLFIFIFVFSELAIFFFYRTAFTNKKDLGKEAREAAWAAEQRTLDGLQSTETKLFAERSTFRDINLMAKEAKRRAEIARMRELHTLKGKVESFAKLGGLDTDAIYTV